MRASVGWKWKAGDCLPQIGCSTCKSSLQEAISVHLHLPTTKFGGMWKCLPIPTGTEGKPAIHYTTIYKVFARWADDGSLWQAFIASVRHLAIAQHLDLHILHGDGTNTVAKKGAMASGTQGTNIRRKKRSWPSPTTTATCELRCPSHPLTRPIWF